MHAQPRVTIEGQINPNDGMRMLSPSPSLFPSPFPCTFENFCLRQVSHGLVLLHTNGTMSLGKLLAVGAVDERNVPELGRCPAHCIVDLQLARCVGDVVRATNYWQKFSKVSVLVRMPALIIPREHVEQNNHHHADT